jgi:hypothetical protein
MRFTVPFSMRIREREIHKLCVTAIDLEPRQLLCRGTAKTDAGAPHIELNRDATEAAGSRSRASSLPKRTTT